jgi:hypothetical protein
VEPYYDWKLMEQTAATLLAASAELTAAAGQIRGTVKRADSVGPFFTKTDESLRQVAEAIEMGARGLRTVGVRLREDAPAAKAAREAFAMRNEARPGPAR